MDRFSRNGFFLKLPLWTGLFLRNGFLKQTLWTGLFLRNGFLKQTLWTGLFLMNGLFEIGNMGSLKSALWTGFQGTVFFEIATMDWSFFKERLF